MVNLARSPSLKIQYYLIRDITVMDIRRLDLNLLLLLDGLFKEQNLSAVARQLGMSQPMASAGLRKLREFFGDQLFLSTGRGMRPTPFAESIAGPVRTVLSTVDHHILRKPHFSPAESDRVFTITTTDIGVLIFIPPILQRIRAVAPNVSLRCVATSHEHLEDALERGEIDLAIGYFPDLIGPNIVTEDLFDHPFTCIARRDHPAIGDNLSLDQFLAADHIVVSQQGRSQEIFERRIRELKLQRRVVLHLPHFMSVPQLVATSDMIATVPFSLGAWYANAGLKLMPPPVSIPLIELKQHWHRRMDNEPAVRWLQSIVAEELRDRDPALAMSADYARSRAKAAALAAAIPPDGKSRYR
ncbi:LysR family transcriptional regulator [Tardiphaga sp. OK245]|uniref:LysR family transcriptional regulator n=1 Tax=Tardiphaga sp. OK245 TaxID=1855306 RepID=UPI0008A74E85|nr:LysR family transcriptional regulator [Tardiphaga sp. OK245]SEI21061.1 transcriptional regulator, LysR family [Tardiphaga sp. OK245]